MTLSYGAIVAVVVFKMLVKVTHRRRVIAMMFIVLEDGSGLYFLMVG